MLDVQSNIHQSGNGPQSASARHQSASAKQAPSEAKAKEDDLTSAQARTIYPGMAYWAVAQTVANRESFAASHIKRAGFDILAPRTKLRIDKRWQVVPLFPGYLFVSIIDRWRIIERTPGVLRLIKFGDAPAKCPDGEIAKLLNQSDASGLVRLPKRPKAAARAKPFEIGARVRIISGSFCGFDAIYAGMTTREREIVRSICSAAARCRSSSMPTSLRSHRNLRPRRICARSAKLRLVTDLFVCARKVRQDRLSPPCGAFSASSSAKSRADRPPEAR
jgi:transcriptional antiterminator RfaH